ncbi:MAG: molecular chaperone TorD family protein, partial [Clostridia bacterium]|nr:molecular chaperone TorD family protein [Clostridia bacterium]
LLELLSLGFTNPSRELASALADGSFSGDLNACLQGLHAYLDAQACGPALAAIQDCGVLFSSEDPVTLFHQINREYTRLFVSPRQEMLPPYEGLYVHRADKKASMFINPSCMHAEQEYRRRAFPFPEKGKIPGDHIAIELRFTAFLIAKHIAACVSQHTESAADASSALSGFVAAHISRWYQPFMLETRKVSQHPFYSLLAQTALVVYPLLIS